MFAYAKEHDLLAFEKGSHEIEGDNLFVNIVEYKDNDTGGKILGSTPSVSGFAFYAQRSGAD